MANFIHSPRYPNWPADAADLLDKLGVKRLPDEEMPERLIDGIRVYVRGLVRVAGKRRNFQGVRVMAICTCGRHLAVGRLRQHVCKRYRVKRLSKLGVQYLYGLSAIGTPEWDSDVTQATWYYKERAMELAGRFGGRVEVVK